MAQKIRQWLLALILCGLLVSCGTTEATPLPVNPIISTLPSPTAVSEWETLAPGLERRSYIPAENPLGQLIALRIDPAYYQFRVHYRPGAPLTARQWVDALPGAVAFVNANFFDPQHEILGLLVADGVVYGSTYPGYGGMFAVQNGIPRVRYNVTEPYWGETLEQAAQAYPMLLVDGAPMYNDANDRQVARRTVVAQDAQGRIVLLVTPLIGLTLTDLSAYLATLDLGLGNALNLDGGASTMLYVAAGARSYLLPSFDPVPAILAIYAR